MIASLLMSCMSKSEPSLRTNSAIIEGTSGHLGEPCKASVPKIIVTDFEIIGMTGVLDRCWTIINCGGVTRSLSVECCLSLLIEDRCIGLILCGCQPQRCHINCHINFTLFVAYCTSLLLRG